MRIFVINLDKDTERLQFTLEQARRNNYEFERIPGVYAAELSDNELKNSVNAIRFTLNLGYKPRLGEIGCGLSHIKIYKKMVEDNIPSACILEDDIFILEHFTEQLNILDNWMDPSKPIVIRLNMPVVESSSETVAIRDHGDTSACSYCLTLAAARALLRENDPMITVADDWPRWDKWGIIDLYNSNPKVCWHNNAASGFSSTIGDIDNQNIPQHLRQYGLSRYWRIAIKAIGRIYDIIYYKVLKKTSALFRITLS